MADLITKGLKQAKYVIDFLNEWKGAGSHSMSDVQAALLSAIQLSGLQPDAAIVDADPCNTAVLTPILTSVVPLESKQDLKNALPKMKTWGDLKTFFDTGAKRGIGEFIATTKRFFDPNSDAILRAAPISGVIQEVAKSLKKIGVPEGKINKIGKDGTLDEYISSGIPIDTQTVAEARATGKALMQQIAKMEAEEALAFDTMALLFATNTLVQRGEISAIRSLELGERVDAYKLKPLHEITDRLMVIGQGGLESIAEISKQEKREKSASEAAVSFSSAAAATETASSVMAAASDVCFGWQEGKCTEPVCPRGWAHPPAAKGRKIFPSQATLKAMAAQQKGNRYFEGDSGGNPRPRGKQQVRFQNRGRESDKDGQVANRWQIDED